MANSVSLRMEGLKELRQALRDLPEHLRDEARDIVLNRAETARAAVDAAYPERTGRLKRGLTLKTEYSAFGVSVLLRNRAPHAHLFEYGTQARHTSIGANRGSMPARPTFIPIVSRQRRAMYEELIELLRREGLTVMGNVA